MIAYLKGAAVQAAATVVIVVFVVVAMAFEQPRLDHVWVLRSVSVVKRAEQTARLAASDATAAVAAAEMPLSSP